MTPVRLLPAAPRSLDKHSTTALPVVVSMLFIVAVIVCGFFVLFVMSGRVFLGRASTK